MLYEIKDAYDKRLRREKEWSHLIIHHTAIGNNVVITDSIWEKLGKNISNFLLAKDDNYASCHFFIDRRGKIERHVDPDFYEAFHAGVSSYWHPKKRTTVMDLNRYAIGIELLGDGNLQEYSDEQYVALVGLTRDLLFRYPTIHPLCIVGHENVSPIRKQDPGIKFNWQKYFMGVYK